MLQVKAHNRKTLVTSSFDQSVSVWNVEEAKLINQLKGTCTHCGLETVYSAEMHNALPQKYWFWCCLQQMASKARVAFHRNTRTSALYGFLQRRTGVCHHSQQSGCPQFADQTGEYLLIKMMFSACNDLHTAVLAQGSRSPLQSECCPQLSGANVECVVSIVRPLTKGECSES